MINPIKQLPSYWVFGVSLILFLLFLVYSQQFSGPAYLSDEIGYLTKAAALAGRTIDHPSSWHAGYSLLLAPVLFITDSHSIAWRGVQSVNALMQACAFLILFRILQRAFPGENDLKILFSAVLATCYPAWILMSGYAFATPAIVLVFCICVYYFFRLKDGLKFAAMGGVATGFLYWIHPTGVAAIFGGCAALAYSSYRTKSWGSLLLYSLFSISTAFTYKWLHNFLQNSMTAEGFQVAEHYRPIEEVIKKILSGDFWGTFPFMLSSQFLSALISSFGLIGIGAVYILRHAKSFEAHGGGENRHAFIFILLTAFGALILGAISFSLEDKIRVDFWIYGRYLDPYLYPLIAVGCVTLLTNPDAIGFGRLSIPIIAGFLFLFALFSGADSSIDNNLVNIPSFWPRALFPENGVYYWLTAGLIGTTLFIVVRPAMGLALALPLVFVSVISGTQWHRQILDNYSRKDAVVDFIESNFKAGSCIAFDEKPRVYGAAERRRMLSFYLYEYTFKRMHVSKWASECDGPFLTQGGVGNLPENSMVVARSARSGISIVVKKEVAYLLDYSSLANTDYFVDSTGNSVCMAYPCIRLSAADLSRNTKVGVFVNDRLTTQSVAGFLFYGPYVSHPKGDYEAVVSLQGTGTAGASLDITSAGGKVIHAKSAIDENALSSEKFSLNFSLENDVQGLEVRLLVTDHSAIEVRDVEIRPLTE